METKKGHKRATTDEIARQLGQGFTADHVKQDICKEPGLNLLVLVRAAVLCPGGRLRVFVGDAADTDTSA